MKAALEASEKAARSKDSAKERSIEAASATTAPPASIKSKIDAAVPAPQPPSVAASRQTRSNANTVRQADVDGRTDVSPKTKKQGQHTAQTAASRTTTAAAQGVAMPMSNLAQLQSMQMMQGGESDVSELSNVSHWCRSILTC